RNGEPGPGKGMTVEKSRGHPDLTADLAYLILIERLQRFDDALHLDQLLNAGNSVVMRLDDGGFSRASGFDRVRIDRALAENPLLVEQVARLDDAFLHAHELFADDVPLLLGVGHTGQCTQELAGRRLY